MIPANTKITNLKDIQELQIYRDGLYAGILRRIKEGCEFKFSEEFLSSSSYQGLSYQIVKQERVVQQGVNLPPFFAGLLPEGLRLRALIREAKTSEDDLFTLLVATGKSCVGDVYAISKETSYPEIIIPKLSQVDFYEYFKKSLETSPSQYHFEGISGVQEKISASMINFPVNIAKKHKSYLLKLNPKDKPNLVQNEWICLALAKKCGLKVNKAKIVRDKNKNPGLLVERFDRFFVPKEKRTRMIHQEDACQFLGYFPADKYRLSLREIGEGIEKYSTAPRVDSLRLLELYAFSYLIGNGDLHAKNISLQTDPLTGRTQLTPGYDLICTAVYGDLKMALKLLGGDDHIKRKDFLEMGRIFDLPSKGIESMLDRLLLKLYENQELLFSIEGLKPSKQKEMKLLLEQRLKDLK